MKQNFGGLGLIAGGDHEAGSICLPGMWEWLTEQFNYWYSSKDLVIIVPESEADKISNLKIFVHEIFKNGERLLTRNIFRYDREIKRVLWIDCGRLLNANFEKQLVLYSF